MSEEADKLFSQAMEIANCEARAAFVKWACRHKPQLFKRVERLLRDAEAAESFFDGLDRTGTDGVQGAVTRNSMFGNAGEQEGQRLGRYRLLQRIGEGGFGSVWMAEQTEPVKRRVALKILKPGMDTREVMARFEAERQALAMLDHPHISKVLDAGATDAGRPFIVMELVQGLPVTDFCNEQRFDIRERLRLFSDICLAVNHAHQKGIIHRDLKPTNVLVTLHEGEPVPMIIDFGIAKAIETKLTPQTLFTRFGQMIGTPVYMSPEQAAIGGLDIDTRSDIYSLGIMLYELLTGKPPFDSDRLARAGFDEMRRIIREVDPPRPSLRIRTTIGQEANLLRDQQQADPGRLSRFVRGDLDWIVMKSICKDRERRYQTATGLAMDIRRFLANEPVIAVPPSKIYRMRKAWRRNRLAFSAAAAVAISLMLGAIISSRQAVRATREAGRATAAEALAAKRLESSNDALRRAENLSADNLKQLIYDYTADGIRRIEGGEASLALPWLVKALELEGNHSANQDLQRVRIRQALSQVPQLYRFWVKPGYARQVKFSPDGDYVLSSSGRVAKREFLDKGVEIWHVPSGKPVQLATDKGELLCVAFSPDSTRLASIAWSGEISIWELATGRLLIQGDGNHTNGCQVLFSPDGTSVLSYGNGGQVTLWNPANGEMLIPRFDTGMALNIHSADFSPDGCKVSILDNDGRILTFETKTGMRLSSIASHGWGVGFRLQYSPDGSYLAAPVADFNTIRVWDSQTGSSLATLRHQNRISSFDISPDGKALASSVRDYGGIVDVRNPRTGELITTPIQLDAPVAMVRFAPDSKHLVTAAWSGLAQVWDARTGSAVGSPLWHSAPLQSVDFHTSGRYIVTGCVDGTVRIWALSSSSAPALTLRPDGPIEHIAVDPSGQRVLTSTPLGDVQVWETTGGEEIAVPTTVAERRPNAGFLPSPRLMEFLDHQPVAQFWNSNGDLEQQVMGTSFAGLDWGQGFAPTIAVTPDQTLAVILFASMDAPGRSGFQIWDLVKPQPFSTAVLDNPAVLFEMSPDGRTFAVVQRRGAPPQDTLSFWLTKTGQMEGSGIVLEGFATAGSFSPDGSVFALATQSVLNLDKPDSNIVQSWNIRTLENFLPPTTLFGTPGTLRYNATGQSIAMSLDNRLRVFDAATGRPMSSPMIHRHQVAAVRFSPDGRYLCSIDGSAFLYVHDASSGLPMTQPIQHPDKLLAAFFAPDSRRIVTACEDGLVRFWDLEPDMSSISQLTVQAHLLSGHEIDEMGVLTPLSGQDCEQLWATWISMLPAGLASIPAIAQADSDPISSDRGTVGSAREKRLAEWHQIEGATVIVSGDPRVENPAGIVLAEGDRYRLFPCPTDTWNTSPLRWGDADYRGHLRKQEPTATGKPFMQLCFAVGSSNWRAVVPGRLITGVGTLRLAPSDVEGGGTAGNNRGQIRVKIVKTD